MIQCVCFLILGSAQVHVPKLIGAPQDALVRQLGPGEVHARVKGVFFHPKGFQYVRVDAVGKAMGLIELGFNEVRPWKVALGDVGLGARHATSQQLKVESSAIQLVRNRVLLGGVSGLPGGSSWKVTCEEVAVLNRDRTRQLKNRIHASTGREHLALIQSCYDWASRMYVTKLKGMGSRG